MLYACMWPRLFMKLVLIFLKYLSPYYTYILSCKCDGFARAICSADSKSFILVLRVCGSSDIPLAYRIICIACLYKLTVNIWKCCKLQHCSISWEPLHKLSVWRRCYVFKQSVQFFVVTYYFWLGKTVMMCYYLLYVI